MNPDHRIELLRLAKPDVSLPDVGLWIARAKELEGYVIDAGQPSKEAPQKTLTLPQAKPGQPAYSGSPAHRR